MKKNKIRANNKRHSAAACLQLEVLFNRVHHHLRPALIDLLRCVLMCFLPWSTTSPAFSDYLSITKGRIRGPLFIFSSMIFFGVVLLFFVHIAGSAFSYGKYNLHSRTLTWLLAATSSISGLLEVWGDQKEPF